MRLVLSGYVSRSSPIRNIHALESEVADASTTQNGLVDTTSLRLCKDLFAYEYLLSHDLEVAHDHPDALYAQY